ncbi:hypothetical protein P7K49_002453, partial [Saguinus oedipus]
MVPPNPEPRLESSLCDVTKERACRGHSCPAPRGPLGPGPAVGYREGPELAER